MAVAPETPKLLPLIVKLFVVDSGHNRTPLPDVAEHVLDVTEVTLGGLYENDNEFVLACDATLTATGRDLPDPAPTLHVRVVPLDTVNTGQLVLPIFAEIKLTSVPKLMPTTVSR